MWFSVVCTLIDNINVKENFFQSVTTIVTQRKSKRCKYSSRIIMTLRQNIHIDIWNGAAMEETIWEGQSTGV